MLALAKLTTKPTHFPLCFRKKFLPTLRNMTHSLIVFQLGWIAFTAMKREIVRNMGNMSRLK